MVTRRVFGLALCLLCAAAASCVLPRPAARLPGTDRSFVAVLSGQMPRPIDRVSRHSWIVTHAAGASEYPRFEMGGGSSRDPFDDFAAGDVMLHGVLEMSADEIAATVRCLGAAKDDYYEKYPRRAYLPIPGPNSNTLVAFLLRRCDLPVELPATAIGRDYVGWLGAQLTEAGTGVQLGTFFFGLRLGLKEGVEVQLLGLPLGVHFWPPGLTLPANPGRLGFASDGHTQRKLQGEDELPADFEPGAAPPRMVGNAALWAKGGATREPAQAAGLQGLGSVGLSARGLFGGRWAYGIGLDLELGAAKPLGLTGAAHLYPFGLGTAILPTGMIALFSGFGTSGATGSLAAGFELVEELRVEVPLARRARLSLAARATFQVTQEQRERADRFADEYRLGAYLHWGKLYGGRDVVYDSGPFFGVEHQQLMGTDFLGVVVGTQIDTAVLRAF